MAKITISTKDFGKAIKQMGKFRIDKLGEVVNELDRVALMVESDAKRNLTDNKSVDTGRLRASIVRHAYGQFNRVVGTNVEYALHVEFGTYRSRAKPYLFPAAEKNRQQFIANLKRILSTT